MSRFAQRSLQRSEEVVYFGVGLLLLVSALLVLGHAGYRLATDVDEGVREAIEAMLDALLITFILVELLSAVRATLEERTLVAEPFILVGIIATIKELVVLAAFGSGELKPSDLALELGTLAGVLLALSVSAWLVRRKEREPEESDDADVDPAGAAS